MTIRSRTARTVARRVTRRLRLGRGALARATWLGVSGWVVAVAVAACSGSASAGSPTSVASPTSPPATTTPAPAPTLAPTPIPTPTASPTPIASPSPTLPPGFSSTGSMSTPRVGHTATALLDGRVLIAGGRNGQAYYASAEVYDPKSGTFSATGSMSTPRVGHTATLLSDGEVLVAGGSDGSGPLASAELYDPTTGKFTPTGAMTTGRSYQVASPVGPSNRQRVLIAGGYGPSGGLIASAELYDATTGAFVATSSMSTTRLGATATELGDGRALIAGGSKTPGGLGLASAELYDASTGTFTTTGSMTVGRDLQTATLLTNEDVLIAGGQGSDRAWASAELYDPKTGKFTKTGSLPANLGDGHAATALSDGRVLLTGGRDPAADRYGAWAALYDPGAGKFTKAGSMTTVRENQTATVLLDGRVLIAGGSNGLTELASAELYQP